MEHRQGIRAMELMGEYEKKNLAGREESDEFYQGSKRGEVMTGSRRLCGR